MDIKFDLEAILKNKELNDLTWEIIEARGISTGDVVKLWETALDLGRSARECSINAMFWGQPDDDGFISDIAPHLIQSYELLAAYFARDAREIVKFLHSRKFEFPPEYIGKRPLGSWGA